MSKVENGRDVETVLEIETVRCIIENEHREVLLLQKSPESKAPDLWEFPGGKIEHIAGIRATDDEKVQAVISEVSEETGIDISHHHPRQIDEFSYQFTTDNKIVARRVTMFFVHLPVSATEVLVNRTVNAKAEPEDKHTRFAWVTRNDLMRFKAEEKLSGNSQQFIKLLAIPE